ncbi:MAG TPA: hypothetical protein ENK02_08050 [Planctomycetes bacterium]|nr:hypothetical protein [Planctomycetota bacterium]
MFGRSSLSTRTTLLGLPFLLAVPFLCGGIRAQHSSRQSHSPQSTPPKGERIEHSPELSLAEQIPALEDLSFWQQHLVQPEGGRVEKRMRGVFPVGNGRVFAYLGLASRANTLQALTGPRYRTLDPRSPKGHFGEMRLDLIERGQVLPLPAQSLWKVRGANIVISEDAEGDFGSPGALALSTINFAWKTSLQRWVEIRNRGKSPRSAQLLLTWDQGSVQAGLLTARDAGMGFEARLVSSRGGRAQGNQFRIDLGEIAPGASKSLVLSFQTKKADGNFPSAKVDQASFTKELGDSLAWWSNKLAGTTRIHTDRQDIQDLLEDWKVLMTVQVSEPSGAVCSMIHNREVGVRGSIGPVLAFLRYGMTRDARRILDYLYKATVVTGELRSSFPLDLDLSQAEAKLRSKGFSWDSIRFPQTEIPAWVLLMHEWYYRTTWDQDMLVERWPFLEACLKAMRGDKFGSFPTSGDEPSLGGAFFSLFPGRVGPNCFFPADTPNRRSRSFVNSVLYMMSINALSELGEDYDRKMAGASRKDEKFQSKKKDFYESFHIDYLQKMEAVFWLPKQKRFAPFRSPITFAPHTAPYGIPNLFPQWIGYTYAIGEKNRENLRSSLSALYLKDNRVGMTPTVGYAPGHLQGLLLYSLCDLEDGRRNDVLDALVDMAGPGGEWGELYDPEGHPVSSYNKEWPNRLSPMESGINIDAIYFALNGIRYVCSPGWSKKDQRFKLRLPNRSRWLSIKHIEHEGHLFDIFLDRVWKRNEGDKQDRTKKKRKLRFRISYDRINKDTAGVDAIDAAINVGQEVYVRYPTLQVPINETGSWPVDDDSFLPKRNGPGPFVPPPPTPKGNPRILYLATNPLAMPPQGAMILDIGLPLLPQQLANLLVDLRKNKRNFDTLLLGVGAMEPNRATFKTKAFWNHRMLVAAANAFTRLGGRIIHPGFLKTGSFVGPLFAKHLDDLDRLDFGAVAKAGGKVHFQSSSPILDLRAILKAKGKALPRGPWVMGIELPFFSPIAGQGILRLGSTGGAKVFLNGQPIVTRKVIREMVPDQDAILVPLRQGQNQLRVLVFQPGPEAKLSLRFTDMKGMPLGNQ